MKKIGILFLFLILLGGIFAYITPIDDFDMRDVFGMYNATNVTAEYFIGNGTFLTGIDEDNKSWNESFADTLYADIKWAYNHTVVSNSYTDTASENLQSNISDVNSTIYNKFIDFNYNQTDGSIVYINLGDINLQSNISDVNSSLDNKFNEFNYNMTDGSYNISYENFAYNQTNPANSYTDITSNNLQINISGVNDSSNIKGLGFNSTLELSEIFINKTEEGNLNVNSSDYWDNLNSFNDTQIENNDGILNILESWITTFVNLWFSGKTTDDLSEGSNLYDNKSWNESYGDTLYADIKWGYNYTGTGDYYYNQTEGSIIYINLGDTNLQSNITNLNSTYHKWWYNYTGTGDYYYNMTTGSIVYINAGDVNLQSNITDLNTTYNKWWYNHTIPSNSYSDVSSNNLQTNISGVNTTNNIRGLVDSSYVDLAGDNMTGNLNMSNNTVETVLNITFTYGGYIRDNVTALIIGHS